VTPVIKTEKGAHHGEESQEGEEDQEEKEVVFESVFSGPGSLSARAFIARARVV
jgi:hypothetical protein